MIKTWQERIPPYTFRGDDWSAEAHNAKNEEINELRARVAEFEAENEAIRTAWEQERNVSDGLAQKLAALESQEPVAHIYPSDLEEFQTSETFAHCYSIAVRCPDERSVPLFLAAGAKP